MGRAAACSAAASSAGLADLAAAAGLAAELGFGTAEDLSLACSAPMLLAPRLFSGSSEASSMVSSCGGRSCSASDRSPDPAKLSLGGVGGFSRGGLGAVASGRIGERGAEGVGTAEGVGAAGGVGAAIADGISRGSLRRVKS